MNRQLKRGIDYIFENDFLLQKPSIEMKEVDSVLLGLALTINGINTSILKLNSLKHHYGIDSLIRTAFENYVSLKYISEEDSEMRAKRYIFTRKLTEYHLADKLLKEDNSGNKIREFLNYTTQDAANLVSEKLDNTLREEIEHIMINELGFQNLRKPTWYNENGKIPNLKVLCDRLELSVDYDLIYNILSKEAHGMDAFSSYNFSDKGIQIQAMQKNISFFANLGSSMTYNSLINIYEFFDHKVKIKELHTLLRLNRYL